MVPWIQSGNGIFHGPIGLVKMWQANEGRSPVTTGRYIYQAHRHALSVAKTLSLVEETEIVFVGLLVVFGVATSFEEFRLLRRIVPPGAVVKSFRTDGIVVTFDIVDRNAVTELEGNVSRKITFRKIFLLLTLLNFSRSF